MTNKEETHAGSTAAVADGSIAQALTRLREDVDRLAALISSGKIGHPLPSAPPPDWVWAHVLETFGERAGRAWLNSECGSLGYRRPIDSCVTAEGADEVDRILTCIDHRMIA